MTRRVHCRLDELLEERAMSLTELSRQVDITPANLSVLKNNRGKAIRFSTLEAICSALDCEISDLLVLHPPRRGNRREGERAAYEQGPAGGRPGARPADPS
jgi:putative transcriptional regulator